MSYGHVKLCLSQLEMTVVYAFSNCLIHFSKSKFLSSGSDITSCARHSNQISPQPPTASEPSSRTITKCAFRLTFQFAQQSLSFFLLLCVCLLRLLYPAIVLLRFMLRLVLVSCGLQCPSMQEAIKYPRRQRGISEDLPCHRHAVSRCAIEHAIGHARSPEGHSGCR